MEPVNKVNMMTQSSGFTPKSQILLLLFTAVFALAFTAACAAPQTVGQPTPPVFTAMNTQDPNIVSADMQAVIDANATVNAHQAVVNAQATGTAQAFVYAQATESAVATANAYATAQAVAQANAYATAQAEATAQAQATANAQATAVAMAQMATADARTETLFQLTVSAEVASATRTAADMAMAQQAEQARLDYEQERLQIDLARERQWNEVIYPTLMVVGGILITLVLGAAVFLLARLVYIRLNPVVIIDANPGQQVFVQRSYAQLPTTIAAPKPLLALPAPSAQEAPSRMMQRLGDSRPSWNGLVEFMAKGDGSLIPIGINVRNRRPILIDRTVNPHVAFCGTTGSGKTVTTLTAIAAQLAAGLHVIAINFKGSDLSGINHPNLTVAPALDYALAPRQIATLFEALLQETKRRDGILAETGARNWQEVPAHLRDSAEIVVVIDEALSIIDAATDAARDPLKSLAEKQEAQAAVLYMWLYLKRITSEARKYGVYVTMTMTDPTKRNLGDSGMRVVSQMTRIATGMNSGASSRVFLDIPANSDYPQGTVGFRPGEFLMNQGGEIRHGQGFYPTADDFQHLFDAVPRPFAPLPRVVTAAIDGNAVRVQPMPQAPVLPSVGRVVSAKLREDAARLGQYIADLRGEKTSMNRIALFIADRTDLTGADGDMYTAAAEALFFRAESGCSWSADFIAGSSSKFLNGAREVVLA